jgi:3-phenylpropionate/trans-cinnamate dioxygenase ferredoxin subunit
MNSKITPGKTLLAGRHGELPDCGRKVVPHGRYGIGLFYVGGTYYALANRCPHEGAELCRGPLTGTVVSGGCPGQYDFQMENRILRCPWHAWEFNIETGCSLFDAKFKVRTYPVRVEHGDILIEV